MTDATQSGRPKPEAADTATAIGVSKVIVPTDVPMASETKHATPNKTATENLVGMIDNIKYATLPHYCDQPRRQTRLQSERSAAS